MKLTEEKEKISYSHDLEVRRILLDKVLFGALIVIAGFVGNLVFEGYKSDLAKTQFLLDKRLEALRELRNSFSKLAHHAFTEAYFEHKAEPAAYARDVNDFMHVINQNGFLFSDKFILELTHHAWMHQAIASPDVQLNPEHWGFLNALGGAFDISTRDALNSEVLGETARTSVTHFRIRHWKSEDVLAKGTAAMFNENFLRWRNDVRSSDREK
jgi:hypothetical protein